MVPGGFGGSQSRPRKGDYGATRLPKTPHAVRGSSFAVEAYSPLVAITTSADAGSDVIGQLLRYGGFRTGRNRRD